MVFDDDFPDEDTLKKENYEEFRLTDIQEKNLREIERAIESNKTANKKDMLNYLQKLHYDISKIKEEECGYEGDENFNINSYLDRITKIIRKLEKT